MKKYLLLAMMVMAAGMARGQGDVSKSLLRKVDSCLKVGNCNLARDYYNDYLNVIKGRKKPDVEQRISECEKQMETIQMEGNDLVFIVDGKEYRYKMVFVEGGMFKMGAQKSNPSGANYDAEAVENEGPVHSVSLKGYYIGETEVTQALWRAVMGGNPSYFKGDNMPVEQVSWNDVQDFIKKLNQLTGRVFRLPTEEEWEYAARGGNKSRGYKYSGSNDKNDVAWYDGNSEKTTHPVKSKKANELGLYDMSGNVFEWCQDFWRDDYSSNERNSNLVMRGGSWYNNVKFCRVMFRSVSYRSARYPNYGLRLVLSR